MSSATSPSSPPPSSVPALIGEHDAAALALEVEAANAVTAPLRRPLADVTRTLRTRWLRTFGSLRGDQSGREFLSILGELAHRLEALRFDPGPGLLDYALRAQRLGGEQGWREAGHAARILPMSLPERTRLAVAEAASAARGKVRVARIAAAVARRGSFTAVTQALAPAQSAVGFLDRAARTVTNDRLNAGIAAVADRLEVDELWIAEHDACVVCLALSGHTRRADGAFDADATFGPKPMTWIPDGGLAQPPRHPNCRCRISPWMARADADETLPHALRREAERSVLKGWAVPSESDLIRKQAADRLLIRISGRDGVSPSGWHVPASVRTSTERRLKAGTLGATPFLGK